MWTAGGRRPTSFSDVEDPGGAEEEEGAAAVGAEEEGLLAPPRGAEEAERVAEPLGVAARVWAQRVRPPAG